MDISTLSKFADIFLNILPLFCTHRYYFPHYKNEETEGVISVSVFPKPGRHIKLPGHFKTIVSMPHTQICLFIWCHIEFMH